MGQVLFNPTTGFNKVQAIAIVLFNTRGHCKYIRIKDNIFRREANHIDQHVVATLTDLLTALKVIGLTIFVKGHHHNSRTMFFA